MNHESQLETQSAVVVSEYLMRIQVPAENVEAVLEAIREVVPLKYGRYEKVAFRHNAGTQQFKPLEGSCSGETALQVVSCDEVSFTLPKDDGILRDVIEAIFGTHPYEEPVIQIQEILSTRFKYESGRDNPNKWWNRADLDWVPSDLRSASKTGES